MRLVLLHIPHTIPATVALAFLWRLATGLWLYTVALRDDRPSSFAIWLHVAVSVAGLAIATVKVAESGRARLARGLDPARFFTDGLSLILAALAVPLLVTGVVLLFAP